MNGSWRLTLLVTVTVVLALLSSSCGGTKNVGTLGNFTIALSGFGGHIGQTFYLKLVDTVTGSTTFLATPTAIATEGFSISQIGIITSGRNYRIDFWVDVDGNGILDRSPNGTPAGVDESWRLTVAADTAGIARTFAYDNNWVDITPY